MTLRGQSSSDPNASTNTIAPPRLNPGHPIPPGDPANRPSVYRIFDDLPKIPLPTNLFDEPPPRSPLMASGVDCLPDSMRSARRISAPLATWLFMSYGQTRKISEGGRTWWQRTCPSDSWLYPAEIYVAAFGIEDLDPGLYHFSVRVRPA